MTVDILGDFHVDKGEVDETSSPMSTRCLPRCWSTRRVKLRSILRMSKVSMESGCFACYQAGSIFDRSVAVKLKRVLKDDDDEK